MPLGSKIWRCRLNANRRTALDELAAVEGSRAAALDAMITIYKHGFAAIVRRDVRGRANAIAANVDLALRSTIGNSPLAAQLREIKRAALEIPVLLGDGADGVRVGQIMILPTSIDAPSSAQSKIRSNRK